MALTKIKADGLTADLIDETKLADNSIDSEHYNDGSIDNAHLADDAVGVAELSATGTASSSTFLRGDNSWVTPTDTNTQLAFANDANNRVVTGDGSGGLNGEANLTFDGDLLSLNKRAVVGNGTDAQIPSRSNTSSYTPQLQVTGAWNDPTHGGTLALNGTSDYPILWLNSGASFVDNSGAGTITFSIKDGAGNYCNTASIISKIDGTPGNNDSPGELLFLTTPDGTCDPTERMRIDSNGYVTLPNQPSFSVKGSSTWHSVSSGQWGTFNLGTASHNVGSIYDTTNKRFTAPVAGVYQVNANMYSASADSNADTDEYCAMQLKLNGSNLSETWSIDHYFHRADQDNTRSGSWLIKMAVNDYIDLSFYASGRTWKYYGAHSSFSAHLLG